MHLGDDRGPHHDTGHQPDDHGHHAPPHVRKRIAVGPQHVGVQDDFDQDERRIEHPVRKEKQGDGNGNRRETVTQRTVDHGGEERDGGKRDRIELGHVRLHPPRQERRCASQGSPPR
jgi:hypothetical protein